MLDKSIVTIIEELREETSFDASFFEKDWYRSKGEIRTKVITSVKLYKVA